MILLAAAGLTTTAGQEQHTSLAARARRTAAATVAFAGRARLCVRFVLALEGHGRGVL